MKGNCVKYNYQATDSCIFNIASCLLQVGVNEQVFVFQPSNLTHI